MSLLFTIIAILIALLLNEFWWRLKKPNDEISRKAIHILVGCFVAFWPYFLGWLDIELMGVAFFISVYISRHFNIFKALHVVQRPTWGELFFALSVVIVALITHDKLAYTTAILSMALADGFAAIFGSYFGKSTRYYIFGHTKSLIGSFVFFVIMVALLANFRHQTTHPLGSLIYIVLALIATALENVSVYGVDNLFIPVLVAIWLH